MNPANMQVSSGTGVLIGIPTLGRPVSLKWAASYKSLGPPINFNMTICQVTGQPIDVARNFMVEEALRLEARYLFFLGDDVVVPAHTLRQLITRLENNKDIGVVGGVYCSKSTPTAPLVFRGNGQGSYWDWKVGEFFEVTGLGMDCTLIRTEVFKGIPKPWFKTTNTDNFADGISKADQWTEDLYFLKQVSDGGKWKIYCDASLICEHEDVLGGKSYGLEPDSLPMQRVRIEGQPRLRVIDIGCGPTHIDFDGNKALRVDIREDVKPDYRCDVRELPFKSGSFDVVFSSHVLEHFPRNEWENVLAEWVRLVAPNGQLRLVLPNIAWAAHMIAVEKVINNDVLNVLYGAQSNPYDYHYNGLTPERVGDALKKLGFTVTKVDLEYYNMMITAHHTVEQLEFAETAVAGFAGE